METNGKDNVDVKIEKKSFLTAIFYIALILIVDIASNGRRRQRRYACEMPDIRF